MGRKACNALPRAIFATKIILEQKAKRAVSVGKGGQTLTQSEAEMLADYNREKYLRESKNLPKAYRRDPSVWMPKHYDSKGRPMRSSQHYVAGRIDPNYVRHEHNDDHSRPTTSESTRTRNRNARKQRVRKTS